MNFNYVLSQNCSEINGKRFSVQTELSYHSHLEKQVPYSGNFAIYVFQENCEESPRKKLHHRCFYFSSFD